MADYPRHGIPGLHRSSDTNDDHEQFFGGGSRLPQPISATRSYSGTNIAGHANAVFGDVNINAPNLAFLQAAGPEDQQRLLLRSLYFENMNSRKTQIDDRASSPKYIEWVWKTNFATWLEGPEAFYWITGKPGSGKSTLMTHVSSSSRTKEALQQNGRQWKVVRFFFDFRAGSSLNNSIEGLLRSLLYQVVRQIPEVVKYIDHDQFEGNTGSWPIGKCLDSLREATDVSSYNICAFIDGLDEFEGSYSKLIEAIYTIKEYVSGIKLCLASRPYLPFEDDFQSFDSLVMQDHNHDSIDLYTSAQWSNHRIDYRSELPQSLCERIRVKANGVFLWARLAVDELLVDFMAQKPIAHLYEQLESMPAEVENMYQRSLERMPEAHQQEAAAILYVLLQTHQGLPIDKLYAVLEQMQAWGQVGQLILPIDCNVDNARRVFAILGDLTDQTLRYADSDIPSYADWEEEETGRPHFVLQNSVIRCCRGKRKHVVLTHETLQSFLRNSSWLTSKIYLAIEANIGHYFWVNIYLREITSRILSVLNPHTDNSQIQQSLLQHNNCMRGRITAIPIRVDERKTSSASQNRSGCTHEADLLKLLRTWPNWSPLLLYAIQEILVELSQLGYNGIGYANRVVPAINSAAIHLHIAICTFRGGDCVCFHRSDLVDSRESPQLAFTGSLESNFQLIPTTIMSHSFGSTYRFEPILTCLMQHGMNNFLPHVVAGSDELMNQKQQIFEQIWETQFASEYYNDEFDAPLLQSFIDLGCELYGGHLCVLSKHISRGMRPGIGDFIAENLSYDNLSHPSTCQFFSRSGDLSGFLEEWHEFWSQRMGGADGLKVLHTLVDRGADVNCIFAQTGDTFLVMSILFHCSPPGISSGFYPEHIAAILELGGNPHLEGKSGNAFKVASEAVKTAEWQNPCWKNERCTHREEQPENPLCKRLVSNAEHIVEVLQEYADINLISTRSGSR